MRLVGADRHMTRRMAAGESLVAALLGLATGTVLFLAARPVIERLTLWDMSVFSSDLRPVPVLAALVAVLVPVAAVLVTALALRRVMIEPLGVVRLAGGRRRRPWWRLVLPLGGIALLYPLTGTAGPRGTGFNEYQVSAGVLLLLFGVAALLPWLVEAVVARLDGGGVSWQLAVRRLQLDAGASVRAVSGVAVAVAAGIALQTLFSAAQNEYVVDTGQEAGLTEITLRTGFEPTTVASIAGRLGSTPGVRDVQVSGSNAVMLTGRNGAAVTSVSLVVGDCSVLRRRAVIDRCAEGDVFIVRDPSQPPDPAEDPRPGQRAVIDPADSVSGTGVPPAWRIPANARPADGRQDGFGGMTTGILATRSAAGERMLPHLTARLELRVDLGEPEALERVRNTTAQVEPLADVLVMGSTRVDSQFASVRRGLLAGTVTTLLLIGGSLLVTMLEQLRERRRLLAALVAIGTPRAVLSRSVFWQAAVPITLGLALAVPAGTGLGAVLLRMTGDRVRFDWPVIGAISVLAAAVVLLVTALSLPALRRLIRPDGLHTE